MIQVSIDLIKSPSITLKSKSQLVFFSIMMDYKEIYFTEHLNFMSYGKNTLILIFLMCVVFFFFVSRHAQKAMGKNKHHER